MKKSGGKRNGAGRKPAQIKTKTKQVRIPIELFEKLKSIKDLAKLTIEFWQSLTVISDKSNFYRKIPILIMKSNDGWRAEIADNYENYKPTKAVYINFEDLDFHFKHEIEKHPNNNFVFKRKKDAVDCAKFCNEKYLAGKAKIWFIS